MPLNCGEKIIQKAGPKAGMKVIPSRVAMRTQSIHGLGRCHYCGDCGRGCDVGGFWNSVSDTLPAAMKTGRMTLRPNSVAREILVDENGRGRGVSFVDRVTKKDYEVRSRAVVLGASALESTRILLNSVSRFWPNGMANGSEVLGHYLMDNFGGPLVFAFLPQLVGSEVTNDDGKSTSVDIVSYRNITDHHPKFIRSYTYEAGQWSEGDFQATQGTFRALGRSLRSRFEVTIRRPSRSTIRFWGRCWPGGRITSRLTKK